MPRGVNRESNFRQRVVELERELGESDAQRVTAERAAAVAEARLVDLRAWGKAVKLFFSALKDANVSARTGPPLQEPRRRDGEIHGGGAARADDAGPEAGPG